MFNGGYYWANTVGAMVNGKTTTKFTLGEYHSNGFTDHVVGSHTRCWMAIWKQS